MKSILFLLTLTLILSNTAFPQSQWYWLQPLPTGATLNSVDFIDRNTGYTCGKAGTITKTTNGGLNWVLLGQITTADLNDIECIDINTCITVGNSGVIFKTTNGGLNWTNIPSGTTGFLQDLDFANNMTGYATGVNGLLLKTTNSGNNWTIIPFGVSSTLHSVSFISGNKGAIGGLNNIYTTTNAGLNWISFQGGTFFDYFETVEYVNDSTVYGLLIPADKVFKSTNSGLSWNSFEIEFLEPTSEIPRWVSFKNENTGYMVTNHGSIGMTTNGGVNWTSDTSFMPPYPYADVFFHVDADDIGNANVSGTGGLVIRTSNSGLSWEKQAGAVQDYSDIFFSNENTGYVSGRYGMLIKTTDAGLTWNSINLNTTFSINQIYFSNTNTGYICGDSRLVMKTTNAGGNWVELITPAADTNITSIYFINSNSGFIGTYGSGTILKTSNSGLNWRHVFKVTGLVGSVTNEFDFMNDMYGVAAANNSIFFTSNSGDNWTSTIFPSRIFRTISFIDSLNIIAGSLQRVIIKSTNGGLS